MACLWPYAPPMHLNLSAILKRVDSTWGHDCFTRRKKIRDLSWNGFKVHVGAGCLWTGSLANLHVRFGGRDFGRHCFAICDGSEICPIFSVIGTWSAPQLQVFGLTYFLFLILFGHSQSIHALLSSLTSLFISTLLPSLDLPDAATTASPKLKISLDLGSVFLRRFCFTCGIIDEGVGDAQVCILKCLSDGCQVLRVLPRFVMSYVESLPTVYFRTSSP